MCNILQIMFQPKLSDGTLYFVNFLHKWWPLWAAGSLAVHCTCLRRQHRPRTGCMNATRSVHCEKLTARSSGSDTRVIRHKNLLTPRSLQFFNSPNIHTCKWLSPIHSIKSLWFCPLEIEFVISCPELSPLHCHSIEKNRVHQQCSAWWVDLCEKQIVSMRGCNGITKILKEKLNQWLLTFCF